MKSSLIRFLKHFFIHMILMGLVLLLLAWGVMTALDSYTHHGESITVPDVTGMTLDQVEQLLDSRNLRYKVMDSTYVSGKLPEAIIDQNPPANAKVKENRRIYLTVNAKVPPKTRMPDLINVDLVNAKIQLKGSGLKLGNVEYVPFSKKIVRSALMNGREIAKDTEIQKGSVVDLIVGNGQSNYYIPVPKLTGLTLAEARSVLGMRQLLEGAIVPNPDVRDRENAFVFRQEPAFGGQIARGEPIDLWLQNEEPFFYDDSETMPDYEGMRRQVEDERDRVLDQGGFPPSPNGVFPDEQSSPAGSNTNNPPGWDSPDK